MHGMSQLIDMIPIVQVCMANVCIEFLGLTQWLDILPSNTKTNLLLNFGVGPQGERKGKVLVAELNLGPFFFIHI